MNAGVSTCETVLVAGGVPAASRAAGTGGNVIEKRQEALDDGADG